VDAKKMTYSVTLLRLSVAHLMSLRIVKEGELGQLSKSAQSVGHQLHLSRRAALGLQ
jgi:hypothetical protein